MHITTKKQAQVRGFGDGWPTRRLRPVRSPSPPARLPHHQAPARRRRASDAKASTNHDLALVRTLRRRDHPFVLVCVNSCPRCDAPAVTETARTRLTCRFGSRMDRFSRHPIWSGISNLRRGPSTMCGGMRGAKAREVRQVQYGEGVRTGPPQPPTSGSDVPEAKPRGAAARGNPRRINAMTVPSFLVVLLTLFPLLRVSATTVTTSSAVTIGTTGSTVIVTFCNDKRIEWAGTVAVQRYLMEQNRWQEYIDDITMTSARKSARVFKVPPAARLVLEWPPDGLDAPFLPKQGVHYRVMFHPWRSSLRSDCGDSIRSQDFFWDKDGRVHVSVEGFSAGETKDSRGQDHH
jgi:hypothetical protein